MSKCDLKGLAEFSEEYLPEEQVAKLFGRNIRTLRQWRKQRQGPAFCKVGGQIIYRRAAVNDWLKSIETQPLCSARVA